MQIIPGFLKKNNKQPEKTNEEKSLTETAPKTPVEPEKIELLEIKEGVKVEIAEVKPSETKTETQPTPSKKVKKKKAVKKNVPTPPVKPANAEELKVTPVKTTSEPIIKNSTFSGVPIRRIYHENKWYFALYDIALLANIPDAKAYLEEVKTKNADLAKGWPKMVRSFVFEENTALECMEADNIMRLIHAFDKPVPGPFSRWLFEVSQKNPK